VRSFCGASVRIVSYGRGSISKVMASEGIGISASYDTSMILWDFKKKRDVEKLMGAHKEAVMDFVWHNSLLVSGDKNGLLAIWVSNT
jgi:WD40 repeat protein